MSLSPQGGKPLPPVPHLQVPPAARGLTDGVDADPARSGAMLLLDGVVEGALTELNRSHTDPETQAEEPGHDRTHLLRTSRAAVNNK